MKAAQHTTYNKKNITLNITEVAKPSNTDKEVLVKVTAAGVNPLDNMISRGEVKMIVPYKLPQTAGNEVVGIVESVGNQVNNLKVGGSCLWASPTRPHRCLCRIRSCR